MATIHPSRMALVSQDPKDIYPERRRGRSPSPRTSKRRDYESHRDTERYRERTDRRDWGRDRDRDRSTPSRREDESERSRERERDFGRDQEKGRDRRRPSPEYSDYKRTASPGPASPWRQPENMYPNRPSRGESYERDRPPHGGGYRSSGSHYLESRRLQRESSTLSIWPPSPKASARALSPKRDSSRRKSKRDRSESSTDSSDSESEHRRRERKERKRARKEKERKERRERKRRRSRSYDDSEEDEREDRRRSKSKSRPRSPSRSRTPSSAHQSEEEWVEKPASAGVFVSAPKTNGAMPPPSIIPSRTVKPVDDDSDEELGPQPLLKTITSKKVDERAYGGALLRGEGSAMAAFLQDSTETRIPRRGEIGLTSDEIASFESVGYVMSGSRHKRMNAVRMRKENQVISAEEKRGILKLQKDERARREAILREEFSELVDEKLKAPEARPK
ncbi:ras-induced vulval development antagonist-domain-containing protein [Phlebopus sp. FC_14]|nr:ras-induced vulval development antagonist-domain-containing protein [Phlebopus sp. FC_14]